MPATPLDLLEIILRFWAQLMTAAGLIGWGVRLEVKARHFAQDLQQLERDVAALAAVSQGQAIGQARIEEALSAIKLTLDRLYAEMRSRD